MTPSHRTERGSVAVIGAVSLVMLVILAGAAIDIGKAVYVRSTLQIAVDAALKAAAAAAITQQSGTDQEILAAATETAKAYIKSNVRLSPALVTYDLEKATDFTVSYVTQNPADPGTNKENTIAVTLNAKVPVSFWRLFFPTIPLVITGRVQRPRAAPVQMVIVADVTESMSEVFDTKTNTTKIASLKTAASKLITTLMSGGDFVRVGLVPSAGFVRLDTSLGYHDAATMTSRVKWLNMGVNPNLPDCSNCTMVSGTCYSDGVPYSCQVKSCTCTNPQPKPWVWDGCVFLRPASITLSDGKVARNSISMAPRTPGGSSIQYYIFASSSTCRALPVITDLVIKDQTKTSTGRPTAEKVLLDKIAALTTVPPNVIGTYLPSGLIWAWNMMVAETTQNGALDDSYPLNSGFTATEVEKMGVRRAVVLITDGNNSMVGTPRTDYDTIMMIQNPSYGDQKKTDLAKETNRDMAAICKGIKDDGIDIYVIGLQLSDDPTDPYRLLLNQCASNGGNGYYFRANNSQDLNDAFAQIGASVSYNRLTE